jgi:glycosyltransferase involved in cell wall biosynthesis
MYSHNCSNVVESLQKNNLAVQVVTSNCRCFSSAQRFSITDEELINGNCSAVRIPHAPSDPGKKHGLAKYFAVKALRLDLWLGAIRGIEYYRRSKHADVIHFDQVLQAFGAVPLFVLICLAGIMHRHVVVTVHEVDPFQRHHAWMNRLYDKCSEVLVYSEHMKKELVQLGTNPEKIRTVRYGTTIPEMRAFERTRYVYFGGHNILKGKGYQKLIEALAILRDKGLLISVLSYVGHGCNGLSEAQEMASKLGVANMIEWADFYTGKDLVEAYQKSKACLIPYTGGSARHPLTCAMANGTPVVATKEVDIPEYLSDLGIYIDGSAESIAGAIETIEAGKLDLDKLGRELRQKAVDELDHNKVAQDLAAVYVGIRSREGLVTIMPASA